MGKKLKIGIITSRGGHLIEILQLKKAFVHGEVFYVTFKGADTNYYLKDAALGMATYQDLLIAAYREF